VEDKMFELMEKMYSEFSTFKNDLTGVKEGVKSLNVKVDKNTLELESINSKIGILAEVQQNMIVQTEKQIQEAIEPICEDISVIKGAVKNISNDVIDVSDKIEFIGMKEFNNERDLFMMKKKLAQ
jgi:predicted  nucleic acid-binding Zn-ribbon protein